MLFYVALLCSLICGLSNASQREEEKKATLSDDDITCFEWFKKNKDPKMFQSLSEEDQVSLAMRYDEKPEQVKKAWNAYIDLFYDHIKQANINQTYDKKQLFTTFLNMRIARENKAIKEPANKGEARLYAFNQLERKEQLTYHKEQYTKDKAAAQKVMKKQGALYANELIKLGIINDSDDARAEEIETFIKKKTAELDAAYGV